MRLFTPGRPGTARFALVSLLLGCAAAVAVRASTPVGSAGGPASPVPAAAAPNVARPWHGAAAVRPVLRHRGPVMRALEPLMLQQARHLVSELQPSAVCPGALLSPLLRGAPSGEHGVRPSAHTAKGLALLVRLLPDEAFSEDFNRGQARAAALAVLRGLLRSHGADGGVCSDGKPWGGQWQSAYWAALAGEACWLLWDDLSADDRRLACEMVRREADRFVGEPPPAQLRHNSRGEENAWNSAVVSLAVCLFPDHPRRAVWLDTARRWIASSFTRQADLARTDLVDGRPLREWISGANLLDDFTLENHGRVHPDYMACTYLLTSQLPLFAWAGLPAPEAIRLNVREIGAVLAGLALPDGSVLYPNGQDWGLRRTVDWFEFYATLAVILDDPRFSGLMRLSLDTLGRMAVRTPRGPIYLPGETKLPSDQHMMLEYPAHVYALMAERGEGPAPEPAERLWSGLAGVRLFESGRFGVARTPRSIASFSWGAQVMGCVVPLGSDLLLAPEARGLIGYVEPETGRAEVPEVRGSTVARFEGGFGVAGVLGRGRGAVEQRFAFAALADGRVVYADSLCKVGAGRLRALSLGTLGVLNDVAWPLHRGERTLAHEGGVARFAAADARTAAPASLDSRWLNLDDRLGIVRAASSGPATYVPAPTSAAGRLEQRLHLNAVPDSVFATPDGVEAALPASALASGVFVFYPNSTAAQTRAASGRVALRTARAGRLLELRLEDGLLLRIDLDASTVAVEPPRSSP